MGFQLSNQTQKQEQPNSSSGFKLSQGSGFNLSSGSGRVVNWDSIDTLTEEDIKGNDRFMSIIRMGYRTRFGKDNRNKYSLDESYDPDISDDELFEEFQNYMRSFAGGQTVTTANEIAWLSGASEEEKAAVGQMYRLFDKMPTFWQKEMGWQERFDAFWDYGKAAIWDPSTVIGMGIGSAWLKGGSKAGAMAAKEVAKRTALKKIGAAVTSPIAQAAAFDATVAFATDAAYQASMIDTKVQSEYSKLQGSLSLLGAVVVPGILAGSRGISKLAGKHGGNYVKLDEALKGQTSPEAVTDAMIRIMKKEGADVENVGDTLSPLLRDFVDDSRKYSRTWSGALKEGENAFEGSTVGSDISDFFRATLLGDGDEVKGLAHMFHDIGFRYVQRNDDDNFANFMGDLIMRVDDYSPGSRSILNDSFDPVFDKFPELSRWKSQLETDFGRSMDNVEAFARLYKQRGSSIGSDLFDYKRAKDILGKAYEEADIKDMFTTVFGQEALRTKKGHMLDKLAWGQTIYKRLLTAHPGTTGANLEGWAVTHGLGRVSDVVEGVLHGGAWAVQTAAGNTEAAAKHWTRAKAGTLGSLRRGFKLFNWVDDLETAEAYFKIRPEVQTKLNRYIAGGVESPAEAIKAWGLDPNKKIVATLDGGATIAQKLSFVQLQDELTKQFSFIAELDKQIARHYDMTFNEFFSQEDAYAKMLTREFALVEARAVDRALRETYSKSFSTGGTPGSFVRNVGKGIESFSRAPGGGFMVPFGQFMNNTFAFMGDYTGINATRHWIGRGIGQSIDLTEEDGVELIAKGITGLGMLHYFGGEHAKDKIMKGLAYFQEERADGTIEDIQYEFPESLYRIYGQAWAHIQLDGRVPAPLVEEMTALTYSQAFRQLDEATKNIHNLIQSSLSGDVDVSFNQAMDLFGNMLSRVASGTTRFAEPYNDAITMGREVGSELLGEGEYDYNVIDRRQGVEAWNRSIRYIDQFFPEIGAGERRYSGTGEDPVKDYGRTFGMGTRSSVETSPFERMLHSVGSRSWKAVRWDGPPELKNYLDRMIEPIVNYKAQRVYEDTDWNNLPLDTRERHVREIIRQSKEEVKEQLKYNFGVNDHAMSRIKEISGYSDAKVRRAMEIMGIEGSLSDLIGADSAEIKLDLILDVLKNPEPYEGFGSPQLEK